jgi:hypothetical protein
VYEGAGEGQRGRERERNSPASSCGTALDSLSLRGADTVGRGLGVAGSCAGGGGSGSFGIGERLDESH